MANETRIEHASETWLADSTVFEVNRVPAHSDHKCYAHDPQTNEWSDLRQSLDGEWRVEVVQASDIEFNEEPFVRENFDDSAFERIQVPGHLQMAGLMNNKYVNIQYPWDGHENPAEPNIPENNHVALYRKTFTMANRLADTKNAGGTVSIVFHGMATAIYVWGNGMFVGYGEDGFTPNEFDITEMLHDGENVVAVDVLQEHRDLLLGIGQAGAQALEELDAAGVALERLLKLHVARLQAADDELQLLRGLLVRKLLDRGLLCHICFLS